MSAYSLYIHIPFCAKKCNYCDFTSYAGLDHFTAPYISALKQELKTYAQVLDEPALKSVYFGGGTPSLLSGESVSDILNTVREHFPLKDKAEISMEVNPGTVNLAKLFSFKKSGVNRLSIGAQSFNDAHLKALGRIHTVNQIHYTFTSARTAGFGNINLDLIFALPSQDAIDWGNTLKKAAALGPEHVSTYNLVIEDGTPFHKERANLSLPSEDEEAAMYEDAIETLSSFGYEHYEISNFAKPGHECGNNLTYWNNEEYIGIGAGATSYIGRSRYSNSTGVEGYMAEWENPGPSLIKEKYESGLQSIGRELSETFFLGLRLTKGLDIKNLKQRFGDKAVIKYENNIKELIELGLLELHGSNLRLTRRGLFLANEVFEKFV